MNKDIEFLIGIKNKIGKLLSEIYSLNEEAEKFISANRASIKSAMPKKGEIYKLLIEEPNEADVHSSIDISERGDFIFAEVTNSRLVINKVRQDGSENQYWFVVPSVRCRMLDENYLPVTGAFDLEEEGYLSINCLGERVAAFSKNKGKCGIVYLINIKGSNLFKIGVTGDTNRRLAELQTSTPFELMVYSVNRCDDPFGVEKELHTMFSEKRETGEWFRLGQRDIHRIASFFNKLTAAA